MFDHPLCGRASYGQTSAAKGVGHEKLLICTGDPKKGVLRLRLRLVARERESL